MMDPEPPADIVQAALDIDEWMAKAGTDDWELCGVASRNLVYRLRDKALMLDQLLAALGDGKVVRRRGRQKPRIDAQGYLLGVDVELPRVKRAQRKKVLRDANGDDIS